MFFWCISDISELMIFFCDKSSRTMYLISNRQREFANCLEYRIYSALMRCVFLYSVCLLIRFFMDKFLMIGWFNDVRFSCFVFYITYICCLFVFIRYLRFTVMQRKIRKVPIYWLSFVIARCWANNDYRIHPRKVAQKNIHMMTETHFNVLCIETKELLQFLSQYAFPHFFYILLLTHVSFICFFLTHFFCIDPLTQVFFATHPLTQAFFTLFL